MRIVILTIFSALLFTACDSLIKYDVLIDNPHYSDLTVQLGDETYDVPGYEYNEVSISRGEYQMTVTDEDGEVLVDEMVEITGDGVLNPTNSIYVRYRDLYIEDAYMDNEMMLESFASTGLDLVDSVEINGNMYYDVDFIVYENQLFIEEDWDYGLYEEWPDEVSVTSSYAAKSKLYDIDRLEDEWFFWGDYDFDDLEGDDDFSGLLDSLQQLIDEMEVENVEAE